VSATRYNWVEQNRVIIQFVKSSTNKVIEELKAELASIKQQDEYKDNLLASVSHDFKTPLNSVLAVLQFLLKYVFTLNQSNGTLDEQTTHYLRVIGKNAHLLLFMIADLLDFSRINKN
jgi:signal transduction histidine kinase